MKKPEGKFAWTVKVGEKDNLSYQKKQEMFLILNQATL